MTGRLPLLCTWLVALAAGTLAAVASHDVAVATGAVSVPALGWLVPVIVEFAAVSAALLGYARAGQGESPWRENCALVALISLAVVVNAAHASGHNPLGVVLAAVPPIVLLGSIHLLLKSRADQALKASVLIAPPVVAHGVVSTPQVVQQKAHGAPQRAASPFARPVSTEAPALPTAAPPKVASAAAVAQSVPAGDRAALVAEMVAEHPQITGAVVAERLKVSPATGRRLIAAHREQLAATT